MNMIITQWIEILHQSPLLYLALVFLFSLVIGSFLNVIILRLPVILDHEWQQQSREYLNVTVEASTPQETFSLAWPQSHCPECKHTLNIFENIPLLSFIFLRARCRYCKNAISWRYPLIELLTAVLSTLYAYYFGVTVTMIAALVFLWILITLTFIDWDHQILPDLLTLPLLWIGLFANIWNLFTPLDQAVLGAIAGYTSLWLITWLFKRVTGKQGMGHGDFKLFAAFGAWFGYTALPIIILLASIFGLLMGIVVLCARKQSYRSTPIPFGPALVFAAILFMIYGNQLMTWYLH